MPIVYFYKRSRSGPEGLYFDYPWRFWSKNKGNSFIAWKEMKNISLKEHKLLKRPFVKVNIGSEQESSHFLAKETDTASMVQILIEKGMKVKTETITDTVLVNE